MATRPAEVRHVTEDEVVFGGDRDLELQVRFAVHRHLLRHILRQSRTEARLNDAAQRSESGHHRDDAERGGRLCQALEDIRTTKEPPAGIAVKLTAVVAAAGQSKGGDPLLRGQSAATLLQSLV